MEKIAIKSLQGGVIVQNSGNPAFKIEFREGEPLLLSKKIGEWLIANNKNFVEATAKESKDAQKPKSLRLYSKTALKDRTKPEQEELLLKYGIKQEDIPKLEDDRVSLILKLQKKAKEGEKP